MDKHTATPWVSKTVKTQVGRCFKLFSPTSTIENIACIYDDDTHDDALNHATHEANAAFIVLAVNAFESLTQENAKLKDAHEELIEALRKTNENIKELCRMSNSYAAQLGIMPNGKDKVRTEDWIIDNSGRNKV